MSAKLPAFLEKIRKENSSKKQQTEIHQSELYDPMAEVEASTRRMNKLNEEYHDRIQQASLNTPINTEGSTIFEEERAKRKNWTPEQKEQLEKEMEEIRKSQKEETIEEWANRIGHDMTHNYDTQTTQSDHSSDDDKDFDASDILETKSSGFDNDDDSFTMEGILGTHTEQPITADDYRKIKADLEQYQKELDFLSSTTSTEEESHGRHR